jgi:hypothetical protein
LRTVTIIGLYRADSPQVPKWAADYLAKPDSRTDFVIACKEWIPGDDNQMRVFRKHAGDAFRLTAAHQQDVKVRLNNLDQTAGDGSFQAYGAQFAPEDKAKLVPGVAYGIEPINISDTYRWAVAADVMKLTWR